MKKLLSIFFILVMILSGFNSCVESKEKNDGDKESCCEIVKADSLAGLWNDAWNSKDRESLQRMIADDAVVMERDWKVEGKDSIFAQWIDKSLPLVSNLKTFPVYRCECCCCVTLSGTYTHEYSSPDGMKSERGNFTFVWREQEDKSWQLELMHMTVL